MSKFSLISKKYPYSPFSINLSSVYIKLKYLLNYEKYIHMTVRMTEFSQIFLKPIYKITEKICAIGPLTLSEIQISYNKSRCKK